jgi:hypothetical protein
MQRKTACPLYPRKRTLVEPVICRNACARTKATDPPIDLDGSLDLGQFWIAPLSGKTQSRLQSIEALTGDDPIGLGIDEREATEVINTVRDRVTSARGPSVAACKRQ